MLSLILCNSENKNTFSLFTTARGIYNVSQFLSRTLIIFALGPYAPEINGVSFGAVLYPTFRVQYSFGVGTTLCRQNNFENKNSGVKKDFPIKS